MWKPITLATLATVFLTLPAHADTHVSYVDEHGKPATQVYVQDGKVRMEMGRDAMLFDAAAGTFTMIDGAERSYVVMDAETMANMAAQAGQMRQMMSGQMAAMQEQMANMPPEQRAMMEQMMGGMSGAGPGAAGGMKAPEIEMRETGDNQRIAGFRCKEVRMLIDGKPAAQMCVAELETLGISGGDRAALNAMHERIQAMAAMGEGAPSVPDIMPQGLALKYVPEGAAARAGGTPETLQAISKGGVSPGMFTVPAGYTEQKIPEMGGR
jgi:hypothetical protein